MPRTANLIVFARAPLLGAVKRRLAADIGDMQAHRFYTGTTGDVLRRLADDRRWRTWLAVTPDMFARSGRFWPAGVSRLPQGQGDLGVRMARALARFPGAPAVLVGSDIPALDSGHIATAFRMLGSHDAVFGPAADGGYWLVGLRRRPRVVDIFRGVRWSGPDALADTLANLERGASAALLEVLSDVDDGEGYKAFRTGSRRRPAARD